MWKAEMVSVGEGGAQDLTGSWLIVGLPLSFEMLCKQAA